MSGLGAARFGTLFGSPLLEHLWPDAAELNPALRAGILDHARQHPGDRQSNRGGWHSRAGGLEFCGAAGRRLLQHMHAMTEEATQRLYRQFDRPPERLSWTLSAWANINNTDDFNATHTHPGATWSGVYYVDAGEAETAIQLLDPNPARTNIFFPELHSAPLQFLPRPGLMILFPSYVPHDVPPHRGAAPRISIAFNVRRDPYP